MKRLAAVKKQKPLVVILSGPTGAGKTVILEQLLKRNSKLATFASVTTRPRGHRKGGDHGYHFVSAKKFDQMRDAGKFLETARTHGYWYGTLRDHLQAVIRRGKVPLRVIDVKGFDKIRHDPHYRFCSIFVTANSLAELKRRVIEREPDIDRAKLQTRLETAKQELKKKGIYDVVIINRRGQLKRAVGQVEAWIDKCLAAG